MNSLPATFTHDGFDFLLLRRTGQVALFSKRKPGHSRPGFEVVLIRQHMAKNIFGREYPERESMPPSESWGLEGWSYCDLVSARQKFDQLTRKRGFSSTPSAVEAFSSSQSVGRAQGEP